MRKTKQEKKLADLRRQSFTSQPISYSIQTPSINKPVDNSLINGPKLTPTAQTQVSSTDSIYIYPVQLIRKDLTKTLILCILAISLELALYLLLERRVALPF